MRRAFAALMGRSSVYTTPVGLFLKENMESDLARAVKEWSGVGAGEPTRRGALVAPAAASVETSPNPHRLWTRYSVARCVRASFATHGLGTYCAGPPSCSG